MIATVEQRGDTRQAPEPAANPLRRGENVVCPKCGVEGDAYDWELKQSRRYAAWTRPVYRCRTRGCAHIFSLAE